jgi:hypothetical protein
MAEILAKNEIMHDGVLSQDEIDAILVCVYFEDMIRFNLGDKTIW